MKKLSENKKIQEIKTKLIPIVTDDAKRRRFQFECMFLLFAAVSLVMTVLNFITAKGELSWVTLAFTIICIMNYGIARFIAKEGTKLSSVLFSLELLALFVYFLISGNPEGFSAIWICLLPACGMLLFSMANTFVLCGVMLAVMIFLFQTPAGRSLLQYQFTETFLMRFPILFVAFFFVSFMMELIRRITQQELTKMRLRSEYLYSHDALTRLLSRHGLMDWQQSTSVTGQQEALMVDIDFFKRVNDSYGHDVGDLVLAGVASEMEKIVGPRICRWGGEEFVAWFPKDDLEDWVPEAIRSAIEKMIVRIPNTEKIVQVTVSVGVARGGPDMPLEELVKLADERLYKAKQTGRNRVVSE